MRIILGCEAKNNFRRNKEIVVATEINMISEYCF